MNPAMLFAQAVADIGEQIRLAVVAKAVITPIVTKPAADVFEAMRNGALLDIRVVVVDRGRLFGKRGETIRALRILAKAVGARHGLHVGLALAEEPHRR